MDTMSINIIKDVAKSLSEGNRELTITTGECIVSLYKVDDKKIDQKALYLVHFNDLGNVKDYYKLKV